MDCSIEELYKNFRGKLKSFINSKVNDDELADDLVQETFIKILQYCKEGKDCVYPKSFLYRILENLTMDYYRSSDWKRKKMTLNINDDEHNDIELQHFTDKDNELKQYAYDCLIPIINSLPSPYKEAVELADIKQLSQKEIAVQMNISVSGVNSRIQRGRVKLKELLLGMCEIEHDCYGNIITCEKRK